MKTAFSLKTPVWKQVLPSQKGKSTDGEKLLKLSGKGLFLGTLAGYRKARNLLRLLNTLETMITTELGSNVEVNPRSYCGYSQNITIQDVTGTRCNEDVTEEAPTKHSYLSLSKRSDTDHIITQRVKLQSTTVISKRLLVET